MFNNKVKIFSILLILYFLFPAKVLAQVEINEFMVDASQEWVEFFNASNSAEYIKTYYLDDDTDFINDSGNSDKKLLSTLDTSNFQYPYFNLASFLNNPGDSVVLFNPEGIVVDQYSYSSNPGAGVTIGRSPDHTGGFTILSSATKGAENSAPLATATPTPTPTPTAGPTSTPTPTPMPTKTPTPKPTVKPTPNVLAETTEEPTPPASQISDLRNQLAAPTPTPMVLGETKKKFPVLSIILIGLGIVLISIPAFLLFKNIYNNKNEESL